MSASASDRRTRRLRIPAALALVCSLGSGGVRPATAQGDAEEIPPPPVGRSAVTVLALLDYNRTLCDSLAGRVIERWQQLGDSPEAERAIRDYLVSDELSELTAGRTANDVARSFFRRMRSETRSEVADSLERLRELIQELCDTVALPSAPRQDFAARVRDVLDDVESEQEELGARLVVSPDDLRAALDPYLMPVQLAGLEAQDEYLAYLESLKPKPRGPTLQELMADWHVGYAAAARPTKEALGKYLQARSAQQTRALAGLCKEILAAVIPLLRNDDVFKIPTPLLPESRGFTTEVLPPLLKAYQEIRDLAVDCTAGRQREVLVHLQEMQDQLQKAAAHLGRFSLTP